MLEEDHDALVAAGEKGLLKLVMVSHAGMTNDEFAAVVRDWLRTARHPRFKRPYTQLVFQPMLELLAYLRAKNFNIYIVSGGGIEFLRVFAEDVYGIPPENVIGSSIKTRYDVRDGKPVLIRMPEINFIDDKEGKPVGINQHIGRRPIFAAGNSDGDLQMLQWTAAGEGPRFCMLVHHTDAEREWKYDRTSRSSTSGSNPPNVVAGRMATAKSFELSRNATQCIPSPPRSRKNSPAVCRQCWGTANRWHFQATPVLSFSISESTSNGRRRRPTSR